MLLLMIGFREQQMSVVWSWLIVFSCLKIKKARGYEVTKKSIGIDELKTYAVYFEKLQNDIKNQQEQVRIAVEYKNCCLKKLEEEISKLKTIEQLKEKKIEEYKTDLLQTEQKELDEIGLQIFKRNVRWQYDWSNQRYCRCYEADKSNWKHDECESFWVKRLEFSKSSR